ncbi:MAG: hypothetical protein QOH31_4265 [Verrucomicrobiota bacterium]|jgi:hypothetical protein
MAKLAKLTANAPVLLVKDAVAAGSTATHPGIQAGY